MIRPYRGLAGLLIPDTTGQRAIEETLADWRDERARAASAAERLLTDARGLMSVARVCTLTGLRELAGADTWRVLALSALAAAGAAMVMSLQLWPAHFAWNSRAGVLAIASLIPQGLVVVFGPVAALGLGTSSDRPTNVLGGMVASAVLVLLLAGWVLPAANQAYRELVWRTLAVDARYLPARGVNELTLLELMAQAGSEREQERRMALRGVSIRTALVAAAPTGFLLGVAIRRRFRSRLRWRALQALGAVAAVAAYFAAVGLRAAIGPGRPGILWLAAGLVWAAILVLGAFRTGMTR